MKISIFFIISLSFLFLLSTGFIATSRSNAASGQELYLKNCSRCHGVDGTKGRFGAKNLQKSRLTGLELKTIVSEGRRFMPSWKRVFKEEDLLAVTDFVITLRKQIP